MRSFFISPTMGKFANVDVEPFCVCMPSQHHDTKGVLKEYMYLCCECSHSNNPIPLGCRERKTSVSTAIKKP